MFFYSCKLDVEVSSELDKKRSVVLRLAKNNSNRLSSIEFPLKLRLNNKSNKSSTFLRIYYNYNHIASRETRVFGISLYQENNEGGLKKNDNKKTRVLAKTKLNYICYSSHYPDSLYSLELNEYIQKLNVLGKDTLHIGTVGEFKQKHKELFKKLTKNDSISIQLLDNGKLGKRITVPVKWN